MKSLTTVQEMNLIMYELDDRVFPYQGGESDTVANMALIAETLLRLPKNVRERVLVEVYFIALSDVGEYGRVCFRSGEPTATVFLSFVSMEKWSKKRKMNLIAHEIAHFILGHEMRPADDVKRKKHINSRDLERDLELMKSRFRDRERQADDLCEKWKFGRCYSQFQLAHLWKD